MSISILSSLNAWRVSLFMKIRKRNYERGYLNDIRGKIAALSNPQELSKEQEKEISNYYTGLIGKDVPHEWHRYFFARTGSFAKEYIPTGFYRTELFGKINNDPFRAAYGDKNLAEVLFPNAPHPKTFLRNINGYYYVDGKPVSEETAIERCKNLGHVIIKPSLECRGKGVQRVAFSDGKIDGTHQTISELFGSYSRDFLVQEVIKQHDIMAALNPSSINTIRIVTYRSGMDVVVLYSVIRIGRKGAVIDNECAGGISTYIDENGRLGRFAYGAPGEDRIEKSDTGVVLSGYVIPSFKEVIELVTGLHYSLPFFNIVGWDIAIGEAGNPILVEWNTCPDFSQSAFGPAFGKYTERIIKDNYYKPNTVNVNW